MSPEPNTLIISGAFDDLRSPEVRFLQEAARLGAVNVLLWPDETIQMLTGRTAKFPAAERIYFLRSLRYVQSAELCEGITDPDELPCLEAAKATTWVLREGEDTPEKRKFCQQTGLETVVIPDRQLAGFPIDPVASQSAAGRKKVLVTGTFDWLHTGHVRFFEEVSEHGALTVVVGHDANIALLKGKGHPLFPQEERRYLVHSIRYVTDTVISTGQGWLDAEPELERLQPDIYAVNEDGDKPEKRAYCQEHGIEYLVLKRTPKAGLPGRSSTDLRGF